MNGIKKTVLLLFIVSAFLLVGTGVSASTTCANGQTYGNFAKNCYMNQCSGQTSCNVQAYKVQKGDSLYTIASNCGTTVNNLKSLNCLNGNCIYPGQVLCTTGDCTSENTCTTSDCASENTCTTGNCTSVNTCTTDNCASGSTCTTSNCTSGNTCATDNCASGSTCTTSNCTSGNTCATGNCANGNYICYSYFCF